MALEVIDRQKRLAMGKRYGLGHGEADDDATQQARPGGRCHAIECAELQPRFLHGIGDQPVEMGDMGAGGEFRHDAAIGRMVRDLRQHDIRQNPARPVSIAPHHGGGGFVAGGFDAENVAR